MLTLDEMLAATLHSGTDSTEAAPLLCTDLSVS